MTAMVMTACTGQKAEKVAPDPVLWQKNSYEY